MTEFALAHRRKFIIGLIILLVFVGFKWSQYQKNHAPAEESIISIDEEAETITEKKAAVITYGQWAPTEVRQVLGQVVSDSNVEVKAELSGTIARVNVAVGDKVYAGQALASFKTSGDPTAINYQSALSSLKTTKLSSQNSVRSAEIALENTQKSLAQTVAQQDQSYNQAYDSLRLEEITITTLLTSALDLIDKHVQFSSKYQYNQNIAYFQIGNSDVIRRQQIKSSGQQLQIQAQSLALSPANANETIVLQNARTRLRLLQELQVVYESLETLIERTAVNTRISETQRDGFLAAVEGVHASIDAKVSAYQAQIESAKGVREGTRLAIINAQNAVESAEQNLELAKAQAEAQVIGAQNQVNIAGASTADLTVRAPISGTVTAKSVRVGDLVSPGLALFTIVNESKNKKVQAYLTQDERRQARLAEAITIEIDGQSVTATDVFLSSQLDTLTQKALAEFTIPAGTTLVGNLATVKIPLGGSNGDNHNLIPFSAVSFEPDGAEVLVLNDARIAKRKKVVVDRVVVSNIEIVSGIEPGEKVVEFYKRVLPGERVISEDLNIGSTDQKTEEEVSNSDA